MTDLSLLIKKWRFYFYKNAGFDKSGKSSYCQYYKGNDQCKREEGCFCRKLAEVRGLIDHVIPSEYKDLSINNARGYITTREGKPQKVWSDDNTAKIQETLRSYLFGGEDILNITDRESYNKYSKMDLRFFEGDNVIIHGSTSVANKFSSRSNPVPTGKTLISCIIMKEAIWRRIYKSNKAETYNIVSYHTLKQDLKAKTDKANNLRESDWLVIDDISLPVIDTDFVHQSFVSLFDDFLMSRMEAKLPTILICDFDVTSRDYTSSIGYSFQKMISSKNSWLISVGGEKNE